MSKKPDKLRPSQITIDSRLQMRAELDESVASDYAEAIKAGKDLGPVTVFHDGTTYWLADGFQRYKAHLASGSKYIPVKVELGPFRDAQIHALSANAQHGLRRSNADKRKAVETALKDTEWGTWSDRRIADLCGVGDRFVSAMRNELTAHRAQSTPQRIGKDGRVIDTSNIGKGKELEQEDGDPFVDSNDNENGSKTTTPDSTKSAVETTPSGTSEFDPDAPPFRQEPVDPFTIPEPEFNPDADDPPEREAQPKKGPSKPARMPSPEYRERKHTVPYDPAKPLRDAKGRLCFTKEQHEAFGGAKAFEAAEEMVDDLIADVESIFKLPHGKCLHVDTLKKHLIDAKSSIAAAKPYVCCPVFDSTKMQTHDDRCPTCGGRAWVPYRQYVNFNKDQMELCDWWGEWDRDDSKKAKKESDE